MLSLLMLENVNIQLYTFVLGGNRKVIGSFKKTFGDYLPSALIVLIFRIHLSL